jgi:hypothetical protein
MPGAGRTSEAPTWTSQAHALHEPARETEGVEEKTTQHGRAAGWLGALGGNARKSSFVPGRMCAPYHLSSSGW